MAETCFRCGKPPEEHIYIGRRRYQYQSLLCPTSTTYLLSPTERTEWIPLVGCAYCSYSLDGWSEMIGHLWERHIDEIVGEALQRFKEYEGES